MDTENNSMNKLLGQLKHEMLELRDQSDNLAKQMWLLYVTFEDLVCLNHSNKSSHLFETTLNIDNYLKSPNSTPKSNVYKKLTDKEVSISSLKVCTKDSKQGRIVKSELIVCSADNSSTCSETICADLCDNNEIKTCCRKISVGYQVAHIQRLGRLHQNNTERADTKIDSNVINQCHSMEIDRPYRRNHKIDKMHYFNGHNSKHNKKCNKWSNCADIVRVDKPANIEDNISSFTVKSPKDLLSQEGGFKHQQIRTQIGDNYRCKRYNPILNITNNSLNRPDDKLSASAMLNVNGCVLDSRVRTLPDTVSKSKLSNKAPFSLPVRQCWNKSVENLSENTKNSNELKRTVLSPLEHAKPEPTRSPKRHCIYMSSKLNYDLLLGENVNQGERSLSDSFEHVLTDSQDSKSQFDDVLLKDVESEMSVANTCDSSPMTISSGYESDSVQTCEAEIDNIFRRNKNKVVKKDAEPSTPTDYFSMSDSLPNIESQIVTDEKVPRVSLSRVPERTLTKEAAKQNIQNALSSKVQLEKEDKDNPARFSPVQRQNYQLTKVARSMFEIIHDLQSEDESSDPNKKKFRKVRRSQSKDMEVQKQTDVTETVQIVDSKSAAGNECAKKCESTKADDQSRLSIRCLRKPLGSEPSRFAMGRKNSKSVFMNNNIEQNKRKDLSDQRNSGGDNRMFKQIGELPFDSQNDGAKKTLQITNLNTTVKNNNVCVPLSKSDVRVQSRDPNLRSSSRDSDFRVPPRESDLRVPTHHGNSQPTSQPTNFSHLNFQEPLVKTSRAWNEFKRHNSHESPRMNSNFVTVQRDSGEQFSLRDHQGQGFSKVNENHNHAVLLRGSRNQNGFQDPNFVESEQVNDNRIPLQDRWNSVNGHVSLWSCNGKMQIVDNGCSPYATTRIPGCQTPRRDERDDHVYETIPGDEFLYEELLRLRMKGILFPKFSKMSDLPGTFIPFEPPALPARNGRRDVTHVNKRDILHSDVNSNLHPTRASFNVQCHSDLVSSDLKSRMRSASWDGYSKIDNDSLFFERGMHTNWSAADLFNRIDDIRQPPPKRRDNFYLLLSNKQKRADFSQSLELETRLKGMGIVLNDKCVNKLNVADGYETMDNLDIDPPEEIGPQFLQSTYV